MNLQPVEKRVSHAEQTHLAVHSIFYTIQGEGPFSGTPAVFVRLAGCNLQCPHCDTDYTSQRAQMTTHEVVEQVRMAKERTLPRSYLSDVGGDSFAMYQGLVVVTGGEPFRQNLDELFKLLVASNCYVQVETNGTLPVSPHTIYNLTTSEQKGVYVVCSPKTGRVHPSIQACACCYKYVMSADSVDPNDGLPVIVLGHPMWDLVARPSYNREFSKTPVYLQPMDQGNAADNARHVKACVDSCMKFGYQLQLQIHKILGMP